MLSSLPAPLCEYFASTEAYCEWIVELLLKEIPEVILPPEWLEDFSHKKLKIARINHTSENDDEYKTTTSFEQQDDTAMTIISYLENDSTKSDSSELRDTQMEANTAITITGVKKSKKRKQTDLDKISDITPTTPQTLQISGELNESDAFPSVPSRLKNLIEAKREEVELLKSLFSYACDGEEKEKYRAELMNQSEQLLKLLKERTKLLE